jgi:hypothetical protein
MEKKLSSGVNSLEMSKEMTASSTTFKLGVAGDKLLLLFFA